MKELKKYVRTILMNAFEIEDIKFRDYTKKRNYKRICSEARLFNLIKKVDTQIHSYEMQKVYPS